MKRKVTIYKGGRKHVEFRGEDKAAKKEQPEKTDTVKNEKVKKSDDKS